MSAPAEQRVSKRDRFEGAPTKYRADYPAQLCAAARDGYSVTAFAGSLGVTRDTLWDWGRRYPAFGEAIQRAKTIRLHAWETIARNLALSCDKVSGGQVAMTIFALKNCDPDEWREKTVVEHDVSDRVADRLEAARLRMLGELKVIDAVPSEGMADTVSAENPANPPHS